LKPRPAALPLAVLASLLVGLTLAPRADGAARKPDITTLSDRVGACFAREDPDCAEPWIAALEARTSTSAAVAYTRGFQALLRGRFDQAAGILDKVAANRLVPRNLHARAIEYRKLARATAAVAADLKRHAMANGRFEVWVRPGPDEVMLPYLERVLKAALPKLEAAFGPAPKAPISVHIYPRVDLLARVSGLTSKQIQSSGTIALCKHNRLMVTSPNDLVFGYPWADTVAHELIHYLIIKNGGDRVPVWLHEGLARSFESAWRGGSALVLDRDEQQALARARKRGRFIPFSRMSPTMARLPTQEATQLAFAEVHHAVRWLLTRPTRPGRAPPAADPAPRDAEVEAAAAARRLVALFGDGADEARALEEFLGVGRKAFVSAWRKALKRDAARPPANLPKGKRRDRLLFKGVAADKGALAALDKEARRFVELGDRLLALERPLAAVIEYRKALARGVAGGPLLVTRLGRALLRLGRTEEAAATIEDALKAHPNHAPLLVLHARVLLAQGKSKAALEAADRAAWVNPFDPGIHRASRRAWLNLGEKAQAASALLREKKLTTP